MSIPIAYNLHSMKSRWTSCVVAVAGIAGTVGVFIATLSLAQGFKSTLVSSGSRDNAIVMRAGATSEIASTIRHDDVRILEDDTGVARDTKNSPVSPEAVVVALFPLRSTGTNTNVQIRGVSTSALEVRSNVSVAEGRFFKPGLAELVVGKRAARDYAGLTVGNTVSFGGGTWTIVGTFDARGSAFDSEVWCDARVLNQIYKRPEGVFQSATVHLSSASAFEEFRTAVASDPRLRVDVVREVDYYDRQSRMLAALLKILGGATAGIMAIGAVFGALNAMYSAVAERSREIAVMRAIGFTATAVAVSFTIEALLISVIGGAIGCAIVLPLNGVAAGGLNWQTFSHVGFAFRLTPILLACGVVFALAMGLVGGVPAAIHAARRPIGIALREL